MREVIIITQPERVKILSDETRFKILQLLRQRPMTIWELSMAIRKDRTTIYRHIKTLENAGFVEELRSEGNEKLYGRTARLFLIKVEPHESIENFRQAYLQVEAERLVEILEKAGIKIKDMERLKKLIKDILNEIEVNSQPVIRKISEANIEMSEIELFHFLNMLVFLQSCELCEKAEKVRELIEI
ncbi:winged helix-turn-helix domain-containing protein [Thermococcus sp.]|uniref:winged helix-turn-helix domain-containing protein n=2 Tax=Thermococcus sp. TaxID=35749 RepID=UPI0025DF272D|nr:winged helix-turn-helix domain-containing protein [Thermococcus sp.]